MRPILQQHRLSDFPRMGPITRVIDPIELGQRLKPFVFLDHFRGEVAPGFGFDKHPQSGLATLTWQPDLDVQYRDTTGQQGVLPAGGLEWMNAGGGAWHEGRLLTGGVAEGFQLWVAMPPEAENGSAQGQYVAPADVPQATDDHNIRVLVMLGSAQHGGQTLSSPIKAHQSIAYGLTELPPCSSWCWSPAPDHQLAWLLIYRGSAAVQGNTLSDTLLEFGDQGDVHLETSACGAHVLWGSAARHQHPLVLGPSSVHTSPEALQRGLAGIRQARALTADW
jgi:redox-sensitive bicupin YhaK (pirin superfamily)